MSTALVDTVITHGAKQMSTILFEVRLTKSILPAQVRAARSLISMTQQDLALAAGVGLSTLQDFESGRRQPMPDNVTAIGVALEAAGVEFIAENGGGAGVRLLKKAN